MTTGLALTAWPCLPPAGPKEQQCWQLDGRQQHRVTLNLTSSHHQPSPPALPRTLTLQPQVLEEGQALEMGTGLARSVPKPSQMQWA